MAEKACQHCDRSTKDRTPHRWLEEPGEPEGAESQRVVEQKLKGVNHPEVYGEVEEAVGHTRHDAHPPALPQREEYQGDHLQRDGAAEGHSE